ncbi:MAG TPA: queuosine salvage family protein [Syntrophobacteraceae bacterium]|nr:queuosine salvage family protein [Syntrophobacteraceae bacterium]
MTDFPVLASVEQVVARSRSVMFHPDRIGPAISQWGDRVDLSSSWEHPCHFFDDSKDSVRWIFTLDVLNHCFWPDPGDPVWTVVYNGEPYSGYWGLAASLRRALVKGFPITDPRFLAAVSAEDLDEIFSGQGRIPMFEKRLKNLREAGSIILSKLGGDILSLFEAAAGSAIRLVRQTVSLFPSFRDEALYGTQRIYFWKRAQIFASDVCTAFGGKKWGKFDDIERLTAFADYKLPQVLREMGIISYLPGLAARIDVLEHLQPCSEEEVEIRAITLWAVEELKKGFAVLGRKLTSPWVDNWLWQLGQLDAFRKRPFHRCRTIFY